VSDREPPQRVTVVDIDVSFGHMVALIIKLALAAVPAMLVLGAVGAVAFAFVAGFLAKS
jgi:hypothetical protein